ncbi:WD40 repeat-like protein [Hesseltinella vesiculosa]|uniref:WD40 repeat-like protein n=1 Tax=Hesseltinella vesiculosa TaxID=101127 RepID=A0A1X2GEE9_9FUNG|nr:WD40 repeat-like protein [Hesseltinella vesiculosa]
MSGEKRKEATSGPSSLIKRARGEDGSNDSALITLSAERSGTSNAIVGTIKRTSTLEAPVMQLTGHEGEVYTCEFDPSGQHIASGSFDRNILLWNTYGDCQNFGVLKGHVNAVLELHWTRDSSQVVSCSADKTVCIWDANSGERVRRWKGHNGVVNSCQVTRRGTEVVVSGSDDGTIKLWDPREKTTSQTLENKYQVTSVAISEAGDTVYSGGIDNDIKVWDLRKQEVMYTLAGHVDTVSGLALSPNGDHLLSNGMDNTVHMWDVKPFAPANRLLKVFEGAPHGFEKNLIRPAWSTDGSQIVCGSADRSVVIWEVLSGKILYKLPGHRGCVNDVDWHPKEPIVMSASTDKTIFLGEVKSTGF